MCHTAVIKVENCFHADRQTDRRPWFMKHCKSEIASPVAVKGNGGGFFKGTKPQSEKFQEKMKKKREAGTVTLCGTDGQMDGLQKSKR